MNTKNKKIIIIIMASIFLSAFSLSCSYIVDRIEAGITKRSSFSIRGSYSPSSGLVAISWEDSLVSATDEAFAGYELYVTRQPDNEFVGYEVIIAPYDIDQYFYRSEYRDCARNEIIFDPDYLGLNGVYFFRLGIIHWNLETKDERSGDDDDDDDTTGWMPDGYGHTFVEYDGSFDPTDQNQWFYENETKLDRISGSIMIDI